MPLLPAVAAAAAAAQAAIAQAAQTGQRDRFELLDLDDAVVPDDTAPAADLSLIAPMRPMALAPDELARSLVGQPIHFILDRYNRSTLIAGYEAPSGNTPRSMTAQYRQATIAELIGSWPRENNNADLRIPMVITETSVLWYGAVARAEGYVCLFAEGDHPGRHICYRAAFKLTVTQQWELVDMTNTNRAISLASGAIEIAPLANLAEVDDATYAVPSGTTTQAIIKLDDTLRVAARTGFTDFKPRQILLPDIVQLQGARAFALFNSANHQQVAIELYDRKLGAIVYALFNYSHGRISTTNGVTLLTEGDTDDNVRRIDLDADEKISAFTAEFVIYVDTRSQDDVVFYASPSWEDGGPPKGVQLTEGQLPKDLRYLTTSAVRYRFEDGSDRDENHAFVWLDARGALQCRIRRAPNGNLRKADYVPLLPSVVGTRWFAASVLVREWFCTWINDHYDFSFTAGFVRTHDGIIRTHRLGATSSAVLDRGLGLYPVSAGAVPHNSISVQGTTNLERLHGVDDIVALETIPQLQPSGRYTATGASEQHIAVRANPVTGLELVPLTTVPAFQRDALRNSYTQATVLDYYDLSVAAAASDTALLAAHHLIRAMSGHIQFLAPEVTDTFSRRLLVMHPAVLTAIDPRGAYNYFELLLQLTGEAEAPRMREDLAGGVEEKILARWYNDARMHEGSPLRWAPPLDVLVTTAENPDPYCLDNNPDLAQRRIKPAELILLPRAVTATGDTTIASRRSEYLDMDEGTAAERAGIAPETQVFPLPEFTQVRLSAGRYSVSNAADPDDADRGVATLRTARVGNVNRALLDGDKQLIGVLHDSRLYWFELERHRPGTTNVLYNQVSGAASRGVATLMLRHPARLLDRPRAIELEGV